MTTSVYEPGTVERGRERSSGGTLSARRAVALVGAAAAASAVVHLVMALGLAAPWIFPDELIYSELAKSIGSGSLPSVRGELSLGYGLVYPALIAPAWALFGDPAGAYVAAKVINTVVMSLAAFPAFSLARRFVSTASAVVVASLSVLIPSLLFSGTLLIEVALYPLFLLALWAMAASLQEPTRGRQVVTVLAIGLACVTKPLAVVLVPAYVLAVLHLGLLDRRAGGSVRARLRSQSTALWIMGGGAAAVVLLSTLSGDPAAVLGVYGVVLGNIDPVGFVVWFVRHLAGLDLYVALAPFVATAVVVVHTLGRRGEARMNEFTALALWSVCGTVTAVAAYASKPHAGAVGYIPTDSRLHGRNTFILVPLLLVGMALFLERRSTWPRRLVLGALTVGIALPLTLPLSRLLENVNTQAPSLILWTTGGIDRFWPLPLVPLACLVTFVLLGNASRMSVRVWALVGTMFVLTTLAANASMSYPTGGASSTAEIGNDTRWIDHAVPARAQVLALWVSSGPERPSYRTIWMSEFYNRSVGRVVEVGRPMPYDLPHTRGVVSDGVLRDAFGSPIAGHYVLAPCSILVRGRVVASDPRVDAVVYRVGSGPIRLARVNPDDGACGSRREEPARGTAGEAA